MVRPRDSDVDLSLLEIRVPKELGHGEKSVTVPVRPADCNLNWIEFLHQQVGESLSQSVKNSQKKLELMDNRAPHNRQTWRLTDKVKLFIDSFRKNKKKYNATLTFRVSGTGRHPQPQPSNNRRKRVLSSAQESASANADTPHPQRVDPSQVSQKMANTLKRKLSLNDSGPVAGPSGTSDTRPGDISITVGGAANKTSDNQTSVFKRQKVVNITSFFDDAASMANTADTEDSVDTVIRDAGGLNDVKSLFIEKLKTISNKQLVMMQSELQKLMAEGKFHRFTSRVPHTACVIMQVISLT